MDRSREPGHKKLKLSVEIDRERLLSQRTSGSTGKGMVPSSFRAGERERREDPIRGLANFLQQREEQDIIAEYKTALAELTFNSKPIITNLTIIAGENMQAARGIVATICTNILEVPSEQKLPSLYLLDSIVKNIGKDYIKYFDSRLREVFCKAYRQVDSSIHPSMRHLFGTWRGIFELSTLHTIEKELQFAAAPNGSSSGTATSRLDPPSQRPAHSIHVNPKYLEARQRLQQISSQEMNNNTRTSVTVDKPVKVANSKVKKPWLGNSTKTPNVQHSRQEHLTEVVRKRNLDARSEGETHVLSSFSNELMSESRRSNERVATEAVEDAWNVARGSADIAEHNEMNGFDTPNAHSNSWDSWSGCGTKQSTQLAENRCGRDACVTWKNSEEEEFMWEDVNSSDSKNTSKKDNLIGGEKSGKDLQRDKWMPSENELLDSWNMPNVPDDYAKSPQREVDDVHPRLRTSGNIGYRSNEDGYSDASAERKVRRSHSPHDLRFSTTLEHFGVVPTQPASQLIPPSKSSTFGLSSPGMAGYLPGGHPSGMSIPMSSGTLPIQAPSIGEMFLRKQQHTLRPVSAPIRPSTWRSDSPPPSTSLIDVELQVQSSHLGNAAPRPAREFKGSMQSPITQDPVSFLSQASVAGNLRYPFSQPHQLSSSTPASFLPFMQQRPQLPLPQPQQSQLDSLSGLSQNLPPKLPGLDLSQVVGHMGTDQFKKTGGAILSTSNTSSLLTAIMSGLVPSSAELSHTNLQPPLPCGPPPVKQGVPSATHESMQSISMDPPRAILPPLPPGPPPPAVSGSHTPNVSDVNSNPFANLLSTLVAQGIITSPAKETPVSTSPKVATQCDSQTTTATMSNLSVPLTSQPLPSPKQVSVDITPKSTSEPQPTVREREKMVGMEFKTDVIREMHPSVILGLFDYLPHQCSTCGFRFNVKEDLERHLAWHGKKHELRSYRRWYTRASEWLTLSLDSMLSANESLLEQMPPVEKPKFMVPADESQCICALCGEPFEDWYCDEQDEWMYKDTLYMPVLGGKTDMNAKDGHGFIVHSKCFS